MGRRWDTASFRVFLDDRLHQVLDDHSSVLARRGFLHQLRGGGRNFERLGRLVESLGPLLSVVGDFSHDALELFFLLLNFVLATLLSLGGLRSVELGNLMCGTLLNLGMLHNFSISYIDSDVGHYFSALG